MSKEYEIMEQYQHREPNPETSLKTITLIRYLKPHICEIDNTWCIKQPVSYPYDKESKTGYVIEAVFELPEMFELKQNDYYGLSIYEKTYYGLSTYERNSYCPLTQTGLTPYVMGWDNYYELKKISEKNLLLETEPS